MSKQVLSIEQMQHLQELGLDISNASMCYYKEEGWEANYFITLACDIREKGGLIYYYDSFSNKEYILSEVIPAFTLQDILELLPYKIVASYLNIGKKSFSGDVLFYIEYSNFGGYAISHFRSESLLDAAYEILCWCIENGHLKMKGNENKSI